MYEVTEALYSIFVFPGILFTIVLGFIYMGFDRKMAARFQNRIGPPIWQPFFDFFKLLSKETIKPKVAPGFFLIAPVVSAASLLTVMISLPILGGVLFRTLDNVILIIYLILMSSVFVMLGGLSSGSPFAAVGSGRYMTQMLAVEFPLLVALFTPAVVVGSLSLTDILMYQASNGFFVFSIPLAAIAFIIALQGELHMTPFDIPDAKQEIIAGPYTEYTGAGLAVFKIMHAAKYVVMISLTVILFFGGIGSIWQFLAKFFLLGLLLTLIRVIFARLKIAQTLKFYWLIIGPIAVIDLVRVMLL